MVVIPAVCLQIPAPAQDQGSMVAGEIAYMNLSLYILASVLSGELSVGKESSQELQVRCSFRSSVPWKAFSSELGQ